MSKREEFATHFRELHPKFSRFFAALLSDIDLTLPQYVLLNQIHLSGTISMTEASKRLRITKPAITNLVDKLEKKKLLKRLPHPKDRRVILLDVQSKGADIVSKTQATTLKIVLSAYDQFDGREHDIIQRFYSVIAHTLDNYLLRISK